MPVLQNGPQRLKQTASPQPACQIQPAVEGSTHETPKELLQQLQPSSFTIKRGEAVNPDEAATHFWKSVQKQKGIYDSKIRGPTPSTRNFCWAGKKTQKKSMLSIEGIWPRHGDTTVKIYLGGENFAMVYMVMLKLSYTHEKVQG